MKNSNFIKKAITFVLMLAMVFALTACGSSSAKNSYRGDYAYAPAEEPMPADMEESYAYDGYDYDGFAASNTAAYGKSAGGEDQAQAPEEKPVEDEIDTQKIIYSASVTIESTEFDEAVAKVQALVDEFGGFIESSSVNGNQYYYSSRGNQSSKSASYAIRVPSASFEAMMNGMNDIGNVPYTHTYTENITAQYYDTRARLNAYRTQEARLLEMMEVAETVEDLITIEDRLTWIRYEIESLQSTMKNWDRQVSYSTINLTLKEVAVYTPEATMTYWEQLKLSAKNGLANAGEFVKDLVLFLAEALPTLLVLAPIVWLIVFIIKRIRRRRKDRPSRKERRQMRKDAKKQGQQPMAENVESESADR